LILKYDKYSQLINSSVIKEKSGFTFLNSSGDFQAALAGLQSHASQRNSAVKNYLSN